MTTTMTIAIETYANLTNRTFNEVLLEMDKGNEIIIDNIVKMMFAITQ
jgi:hypothetical protein